MGIAAAAVMRASPASAGGYERGYDNGYYGSYKDSAPYYQYQAPVYQPAPVTVYQAAPVYVPAPTYYAYPVYSYGYGYADCGCKRWRKRWRRGCW
jgi:hypothetical protein